MTSASEFPCERRSVPAARHFTRQALASWPERVIDAAELMVSELATNCVRHAHSTFEIAIETSEQQIKVAVTDTGEGEPVLLSPSPLDPSGRGLRIVRELANAWGVVASPHGKTVWFTLPEKTGDERAHGRRRRHVPRLLARMQAR